MHFVQTTRPTIHAPATVDEKRPLERPFTIANGHYWYTLFGAHPYCRIVNLFADGNISIQGGGAFHREGEIADLEPNSQPRDFYCAATDLKPEGRTNHIYVDVNVDYRVHWSPWTERPYTHSQRFSFRRDNDGNGYWLDRPFADSLLRK